MHRFLKIFALGATLSLGAGFASAEAAEIKVFKSESCGCCGGWVEHMKANGHQVTVRNTDDMDMIKKLAGVPENMESCHTAMVNGYVVEGHVPAKDLEAFLAAKPQARGIAVPGMPTGSLGMETPDGEVEPYVVVSFDSDGSHKVLKRY